MYYPLAYPKIYYYSALAPATKPPTRQDKLQYGIIYWGYNMIFTPCKLELGTEAALKK